jgi:hypothetical protein
MDKRNSTVHLAVWQPSVDSTCHLDDVSRSISDQGGVTSLRLDFVTKINFCAANANSFERFQFHDKTLQKDLGRLPFSSLLLILVSSDLMNNSAGGGGRWAV